MFHANIIMAKNPVEAGRMAVDEFEAVLRVKPACVMVLTGAYKAEILRKSFFGPVTPEVPASVLQFHPDVTLICDEAAFPG